ncbi:MAG: cytochrome c [Deltaproteobacteria bacterium]|nr:cytochrome c [Deltaproteobacteria bacterium]
MKGLDGMARKISVIVLALFVTTILTKGRVFAASAEENYKWFCAQCHGLQGKGDGPNATKEMPVNPRNHTDAKEMEKLTVADVENVIRDGGAATSKSTIMPPWGKTLTDEEVKEIVAYLGKLCNCKFK